MSKRAERSVVMRQVLAELEASGLSARAFALDRKIPMSTLNYWKKKLTARGGRSAFAEVRVIPAPPTAEAAAAVIVELANRRKLHVVPGVDSKELVRLIGVLESC